MSSGVGVHAQRLLRIVEAVQEELSPERQRSLVLSFQILCRRDHEIQVQLLRDRPLWPCRPRELGHLLERHPGGAGGVLQHQPVLSRRIRFARGRSLVARPVPKAEQFPVELRERARIGAVQHDLTKLRESLLGLHGTTPARVSLEARLLHRMPKALSSTRRPAAVNNVGGNYT
jgi:hypothetical protein